MHRRRLPQSLAEGCGLTIGKTVADPSKSFNLHPQLARILELLCRAVISMAADCLARRRRLKPMPKILTPVNFGAFALDHRVATVISPSLSESHPMSAQGAIGAGGLFIHPFSPLTVPQRMIDSAVNDLAAWQTYNDTIRLAGGTIIARGTPHERAMPPLPEKGVLRAGSIQQLGHSGPGG